jgi:hypothetical protein
MAWYIRRPFDEASFDYLCDVEFDRWNLDHRHARCFRSREDAESRLKRSDEKVVYWDPVTRSFPFDYPFQDPSR